MHLEIAPRQSMSSIVVQTIYDPQIPAELGPKRPTRLARPHLSMRRRKRCPQRRQTHNAAGGDGIHPEQNHGAVVHECIRFLFPPDSTHPPGSASSGQGKMECSKDPWTEQRGRKKDEKRVSTIIAHDNLPAHRRRLKSAERDLSYCLMPSGPFASGPATSPVLRRSAARRSTSFCLRWG